MFCNRGDGMKNRNKTSNYRILLATAISIFISVACYLNFPVLLTEVAFPSPTKPNLESTAALEIPTTEVFPTDTPTIEPTLPPPTPTFSATPLPPLPSTPQLVEFTAEDGRELQGIYYPAAENPAPMVVLMHWAGGDRNDWNEIAYWLQNRDLLETSENVGSQPWLDPSWFPEIPESKSYAVFTFTFRGFDGVGDNVSPSGWLLDAQAAIKISRELEGVDPTKIVAIGASIGADGAVDACGESCLGGLAISPGSYLDLPFSGVVSALESSDPAKIIWCLAAEGDSFSADTCRSASGDHLNTIIYPGDEHGMLLLKPEMDPDTMQIILEFLEQTLEG
jgi:dienelactone hydrolase